MGNCITHKKMYATQEMAEEALIAAHVKFEYAANHGPLATYKCEDCGAYHLTSKGPMNQKLATYISDGKLKLDKEADKWLGKFKNRW